MRAICPRCNTWADKKYRITFAVQEEYFDCGRCGHLTLHTQNKVGGLPTAARWLVFVIAGVVWWSILGIIDLAASVRNIATVGQFIDWPHFFISQAVLGAIIGHCHRYVLLRRDDRARWWNKLENGFDAGFRLLFPGRGAFFIDDVVLTLLIVLFSMAGLFQGIALGTPLFLRAATTITVRPSWLIGAIGLILGLVSVFPLTLLTRGMRIALHLGEPEITGTKWLV